MLAQAVCSTAQGGVFVAHSVIVVRVWTEAVCSLAQVGTLVREYAHAVTVTGT